MNKVREYLQNPLYTGIAGLVIGTLFGLLVLGWGLFPVRWTDGQPVDLHPEFQKDYLKSAIYAYSADSNPQLALQRYNNLGEDAEGILNELMQDPTIDSKMKTNFLEAVAMSGSVVQPPVVEPTTAAAPIIIPTEEAKKPISSGALLAILCVVLLGIGGALVYILFLRKKGTAAQEYVPPKPEERAVARPVRQQPEPQKAVSKPQPIVEEPVEQEIPVAQFMTTYMMGDDLYDDSFSIDSPTGEFLGECGVGISETIGVGDPKKVTAFEVWLFDKNDIQTVTKVIMSDHAWNDVAISQRLAAKGEPVLMAPGKQVLLETASLILEARVVDVAYGQGSLPANSFFDRLTLELAVWQK